MIICITGTPGTGKTKIAKQLSKKMGLDYCDLNDLIIKNKLYSRYNKKFKTHEVDIKLLNKFLVKFIKGKNLLIDSHLSHYLPAKYVDFCVVCKCNIKTLKKRLGKRRYNQIKIRENLDSEIFDVCLVEALDNKHKVIVVDTTNKSVKKCVLDVMKESN